ncbi:2'-5' RNA ligase family protein [Candidatus Woesearchaeota archaeon]|nr:2'-5' RNA ligase family protein [Candidatus Woesearchaeota archaeon]
MKKIAIDVVLLPPEEIMDLCIEVNEKAFKKGKGRHKLNKVNCVPHISLTMGCVYDDKLPCMIRDLGKISAATEPLTLKITGVEMYGPEGERRGFLKINVPKKLRELHNEIHYRIARHVVNCDGPYVLVDGESTGISDSSKEMLNKHSKTQFGDDYNPHLTLCCYDSDKFCKDLKFPISFNVSKIALFQLGDGCTCKKLLNEFSLE